MNLIVSFASDGILNIQISTPVGSIFSAGSVIDKCISWNSDGLSFARLIDVSSSALPNSTSIASPPYSTMLDALNSESAKTKGHEP